MKKLILVTFALLTFGLSLHVAHAASWEVSGWIPWWRAATGTQEAMAHFDTLTEVNPFGFTVKKDGRLNDALGIDKDPWPAFVAAAHARKVRVIPTVTWSDTNAMHVVLSQKVLRDAQIASIMDTVNKYGFDGIDIDFEQKLADDRANFSIFLRDLYKAMGKKWVDCDVEPRTPIGDRYDTIPADYNEQYYANDYVMINKYCDRVRIMAYDQASIDRKLNGVTVDPYSPVADPKWVEKVLQLALKTISKSKIILGVATYGYEYKVTPLASGYSYKFLWALNPKYAVDTAAAYGKTPTRNIADELSFTYTSTSTPLLDNSFNLIWWSDAQAIKDKVTLAKKYGLRGVAIFKIDGGADPGIWSILK